jgi:branched-chain amino acid transport system permease protein
MGLVGSALPVSLILGLALAAAMLVCMALGVTIERAAYRPLRRAPRLAPLITAIGVSILIQYTAALIWSKQYIALPEIIKPSQFTVAGASFTDLQLFIFVLACSVMAGLLWFIKHTRIGRAMRATEQNPQVAGLRASTSIASSLSHSSSARRWARWRVSWWCCTTASAITSWVSCSA